MIRCVPLISLVDDVNISMVRIGIVYPIRNRQIVELCAVMQSSGIKEHLNAILLNLDTIANMAPVKEDFSCWKQNIIVGRSSNIQYDTA